jgi:hypothetical protein
MTAKKRFLPLFKRQLEKSPESERDFAQRETIPVELKLFNSMFHKENYLIHSAPK